MRENVSLDSGKKKNIRGHASMGKGGIRIELEDP